MLDREVADQHFPGLAAFGEWVGLGVRPDDLFSVGGPIGVEVVIGDPAGRRIYRIRRWGRSSLSGGTGVIRPRA